MYAIEFRTKVKNGLIEIPPEYRSKLKDYVKVIILAEEKQTTSNIIDKLLNSPLKLKQFKPLSREEIYGRFLKTSPSCALSIPIFGSMLLSIPKRIISRLWPSILFKAQYICTLTCQEVVMTIKTTYTQARANLAKLLDQAVADREVIIIERRGADPVALIAAEELSGLLETAHLLRSPANAQRLLAALARALDPEQTLPPQTIADLRREVGLNE